MDLKLHFENQEKDEQVLLLLRAHPLTNLGWILAVIGLALLGLGLFALALSSESVLEFFSPTDLVLGFFAWILILFGYVIGRYLSWFFNVNLVTNKKIVDVDFFHIFYKQIAQTALENVQDVTTKTGGFFQNHFDYGDVMVQTAGEKIYFQFSLVPDPEGVQKKIIELAEARRDEMGVEPL